MQFRRIYAPPPAPFPFPHSYAVPELPIFRHISKVFCRMFQFYCKFDLFMLFLFLDDIPFFCHDFFVRNLMKARTL